VSAQRSRHYNLDASLNLPGELSIFEAVFINNGHKSTNNKHMLEAKCPDCGKKALVDDEMTEVKCSHCGFVAPYDDYIEIMKGKAVDFADNFQMSWDRNPF
jgi:ribosomal protein S27E